MRKFWISLLAVLMSVGLVFGAVGCGEKTAEKQEPAPVEEVQPQEPEINAEEVIDAAVTKYYNPLPEHKYLIKPDELKTLLAEKPDSVLFIDIRAAEDYAKGHVKGAVNVPFGKVGEMLEVIRANAEGKEVVVSCYTGQTAGQTVSLLNAAGIPAKSLLDGMGKDGYNKGWKTIGNEVVTEEAKFAKEAGAALEGEAKVLADAVVSFFANMPEHKNLIKPDELKTVLAESADTLYFIDIRAAEDFAKGHVKGAVNIPYGKVGENLAKIKTDAQGKKVVVSCYTGQTAGQTVSLLKIAGIEAQSLLDGMGKDGYNKGWATAGNEVVTE